MGANNLFFNNQILLKMKNLKRSNSEFQAKKAVISKYKTESKVNGYGFRKQKEALIAQIVGSKTPNFGSLKLTVI